MNVERREHKNVIKCLYKYIHKGHNCSKVIIEGNMSDRNYGQSLLIYYDEVKLYLDCHYVSTIELYSWIITWNYKSSSP